MNNRTEITIPDAICVPPHLASTVAAALAAGLRTSLFTVRELTVVHIFQDGEWRYFDPLKRWGDAMTVFALRGAGSFGISATSGYVVCEFPGFYRHVVNPRDYNGDVFAAMRAAIVLAAQKAYKHDLSRTTV